jgi:hypothetical protein
MNNNNLNFNVNSNLNLNKIKTKPANAIIKPFNKELVDSFFSGKSNECTKSKHTKSKHTKSKHAKNNSEFKDDMQKYQDSFDDIIKFSKIISLPKKMSIN